MTQDLREILQHALNDRTPLWRASYPYSHLIMKAGQFQSPHGADEDSSGELRKTLADQVPLCIVLKGSAEVFDSQGQPLQLIRPARMFGVYEALDSFLKIPQSSSGYYSVSAGCRSIHVVGDFGNVKVIEELGD